MGRPSPRRARYSIGRGPCSGAIYVARCRDRFRLGGVVAERLTCRSGRLLCRLIPDSKQVHAHGDVQRERCPRRHQRNQRCSDIYRESDAKAATDSPDGLHVDPRAARNRCDQHVECATADDERCAIEGDRRSDFRSSQVSRQHRGGERDKRHIEKYEAVRELYRVACHADQPYDVVMGDPRDEDDEEAERKREVVRPERQQTGQQASFGPRVLQADFEDEQRNRNGKHAIAERLDAGGAFCQCRDWPLAISSLILPQLRTNCRATPAPFRLRTATRENTQGRNASSRAVLCRLSVEVESSSTMSRNSRCRSASLRFSISMDAAVSSAGCQPKKSAWPVKSAWRNSALTCRS